jgi:hypothetical protein
VRRIASGEKQNGNECRDAQHAAGYSLRPAGSLQPDIGYIESLRHFVNAHVAPQQNAEADEMPIGAKTG